MKSWSMSSKGKRVQRTHGVKGRFLSLILAAAILSGMLLTSSVGVEGNQAAPHDQVTDPGITRYYTAAGAEADLSNYDVSVSKKVTQAVDGSNSPIENQFKVDLTVETRTDYTSITTTRDAAVVLVVDMSSSMVSQCAECGYYEKPMVGDPIRPANAHCKNGETNPPYYCTSTQAGAGGLYTSDTPGGNCRNCKGSFAGAHGRQHVFVSRIKTAERDVKTFLEEYVKSTEAARRELVVLTYSDSVAQTVPWQNVAGLDDAGIMALIGKIFKTNGTTTNTVEAMSQAKNALGHIPEGVPLNQASVILMTDGVPNDAGDVGYSGGFQTEYNAVIQYCKEYKNKALFSSRLSAYSSIASYGLQIRDLGAAMYTICFSSGEDSYYLAQYLMKFPNVGYDAGSATGLGDAFTDIIEKMTELRPNTVADVLPANFHYVPNSFDGMGKNTATESGGAISWVLSQLNPGNPDQNGHYTYQLSYKMKLDNLGVSYTNGVSSLPIPVNQQAPTFSFQQYTTVDNVTAPVGPMRTVSFAIPKVECYSGEVSFTKVDPQDVPVRKKAPEASIFALFLNPGDEKPVATATNAGEGIIAFRDVPSGHTYTMKETKPPDGMVTEENASWTATVAWGAAGTITDKQDQPVTRIKNYYDPKLIEIPVQKIWKDTTNIYQGQTVNYTVTGSDGETYSGTLNYADNKTADPHIWKGTIKVPSISKTIGKEVTYTISESPINGYTTVCSGGNDLTMINTLATRRLKVTKTWVGEPTDGTAFTRPNVTISVYGVDSATPVATKTIQGGLARDLSTELTFDNLPVIDGNGSQIAYYIKETIAPSDPGGAADATYTSAVRGSMENGYTLTNTYVTPEATTQNFVVHVHWEGDGKTPEKRPESVSVWLEKSTDGTDWTTLKDSTTQTLSKSTFEGKDIWIYEYQDLPLYEDVNSVKTEIFYRVAQGIQEPGSGVCENYTTSYKDNNYDVFNTLKLISVTVSKTWAKPADVTAPPVTFDLYVSNGKEPLKNHMMQPGETEYTFTDLPAGSVYEVRERPVAGYTSVKDPNSPSFTNTIEDLKDMTVTGTIEWKFRGEPEAYPGKVVLELWSNRAPVLDGNGNKITAEATAEGNWGFKFENLPRYQADGYGYMDYSIRELDKDGLAAADASTIILTVGESPKDFGVHYHPVTKSPDGLTVTCNLYNHVNAEIKEYVSRVDRVYTHYQDDVAGLPVNVTGAEDKRDSEYSLSVNTGTYAVQDGKTYIFKSGVVTIGSINSGRASLPTIAGGENTIPIDQSDGVYIITLQYELRETTYVPPYVPDPDPPTTPTPSVTPTPSPSVTPTPTPTTPPPTESPTTPPTPTPPPTTGPTTPPSPDVRPTPPVLPPEVQEKVDEIIKDVTENPDHIIKDKDGFEERFPEISIEDLPPPLYWGPEFAIVEVPFYEEIIAIDSGLVPLGNLPQTGSDMQTVAVITALAGMAAIVLACTAALCGWLLRRKEQEAE